MYKVQKSFTEGQCNQIVTALLDKEYGTRFQLERPGGTRILMEKIADTAAFSGDLGGVHKCVGIVTNQFPEFQAEVFVRLIPIDDGRGSARCSGQRKEASEKSGRAAAAADSRAKQFGTKRNY